MTIWTTLFGGKSEPDATPPLKGGTPGGSAAPAPRYPMPEATTRLVAIGDVHGRADLLSVMFRRLDALAADGGAPVTEIYLGDYIDRGPESKSVLHLLRERALSRSNIVTLIGNHEELLVRALADDVTFEQWLSVGGRATLASYCPGELLLQADTSTARQAFAAAFPPAHLAFLSTLKASYTYGGFFFTHAGVRPGVPLSEQNPQDLRWIREPFLSFGGDFGAIVVHGHTPGREPVFRPNRICIDTGAFHTGRLTALLIEARGASVLEATL